MKKTFFILIHFYFIMFSPLQIQAADFGQLTFSFKISKKNPGEKKLFLFNTSVNEIEKTLLLNYNIKNFFKLMMTEEQKKKNIAPSISQS